MLGRGYKSATEEVIERQMRREMEYRNSAIGQLTEKQVRRTSDPMYQMMEREMRRMSDPVYQMMLRAAQNPGPSVHERRLWYYRRVTDLVSFEDIRKVVAKLLKDLFPKYDPESLARRIRAALITQDERNGVIKSHSPPVRIIPKTLHPIESVA